mmetsp:Transcript_19877/g.14612  ORF Transcript_19877/g.14612 Transcript_19877/m.14612 type:complete len:110 (-) Transcript_19877:6-335(-)
MLLSNIYYLLILFVFVDCLQLQGAQLMRSIEKQGTASIIAFIGYCCIGVPLAIYLTFFLNWGMHGLLLGMSIAVIFNFSCYFSVVLRMDWKLIVEQVHQRKQLEKQVLI